MMVVSMRPVSHQVTKLHQPVGRDQLILHMYRIETFDAD